MNKTCGSKSFKALMVTQFMAAFNDNAFKMIVSLLAIRYLPSEDEASRFISLVGLLFMLPFVLLSPWAGMFADRFPKRRMISVMQGFKVLNLGLAFFALGAGKLGVLCAVLFLFMVESAFLSPAKYGILPEILKDEELSKGNGYIQLWTFVAVILGTASGGQLMGWFHHHIADSALVMMGLAVVGLGASFLIEGEVKPAQAGPLPWNLWQDAKQGFKEIRKDQGLFLTLLGLAYFSFMGAIFQMNILLYGTKALHLPEVWAGSLLVAVLVGIGIGGVVAGWLSEKKIELGLVPLGAIGISWHCFLLGAVPKDFSSALINLFFLGMSAGFYNVPLNAFFQRYSPEAKRGQYLAVLNIVNAFSVILASLFLWILSGQGVVSSSGIFIWLGVVSIGATIAIVLTLPMAFVRLINWIIAHSIYHFESCGVHNVPAKGGALIVSNHISFVDAILILASLPRHVRFVMNQQMYNLPIVNTLARALKVIPIDPKAGPKAMLATLNLAKEAIRLGELVCLFPEGHLTRTGNMLPFQKGLEFIMRDLEAPIIPLYLDNIWGSIFSYSDGKYFWKIPQSTRYPVTLVFGKPLPASSKVHEVRLVVQELGAEANMARGLFRQKLHLSFIDEVKRHTFCFCMADSSGMRLKYFEVLVGALGLNAGLFPKARRPKETNEMVGILLPSSCVAAMANLAVAYAGKVPVNLNFTLSQEAFQSCIRQCQMKMIVTSRLFLKKINLEKQEGMIFVEDLLPNLSGALKCWLAVCAVMLPGWMLKRLFAKGDRKNVDDTATVIFSSGSTGEPKGVCLTHANIFSNIESFYQVFDVHHHDVVMAALPFFHSFGFTATMCFPIGTGMGVVYHTNPVDAATIGKLSQEYKATILMGTPTFMSAYLRKCTPEQFQTLRIAVVGAEKLKESLANAFFEKFKVMPYEGYGATELSPIAAVGFPGYYNPVTRERQVGHKAGTVGHPIPGVAVKVVDPDTFALKGYDEEGLLLVKGANVMKGYLNNPTKTAEVLKDGWYVTGDMAVIDSDGFVKITDRLSRFSKIGGEMVPHIKIEENIMEIVGAVDPVLAVTAVSDEKKGEKLVVLHTIELDAASVCESLANHGLPNLWIPKKENFYKVDAIPQLGTGKVDLKGVKTLAEKLVQASLA